ncbi:MAG: peptide chain release factor 2 [Candidatus Babeliales bacterium]
MLLDDLREQLKSFEPDIQTIKTFWANAKFEERFTTLQTQSLQENFWQNPDQAAILKELQHLKNQREQYHTIINTQTEIPELLNLFATDEQELQKLSYDIKALGRMVVKFKVSLLLSEPHDQSPCFLSINAGAGGTESQDWANILLRMYTRFCEREGLNYEIMDYQGGEEAGIKSATLYITGKNAYGLLKNEIGIHRLVRISPFDSAKRRHTSFAAVAATPEMPEIKIDIDPNDLRIDTYRAGGAGGQHVNKTDSAVRITHIPTNIVTQSQSQRSQHQNKETAMKMLMAKLVEKEEAEQKSKDASTEKKKIEWGSQIRSYILHPYKMVKDHRTDLESPQPDLVLDGDIMEFIEGYLITIQ